MQGKQKKSVFLFPQKRLQRIVLKKGVHAEKKQCLINSFAFH